MALERDDPAHFSSKKFLREQAGHSTYFVALDIMLVMMLDDLSPNQMLQ